MSSEVYKLIAKHPKTLRSKFVFIPFTESHMDQTD